MDFPDEDNPHFWQPFLVSKQAKESHPKKVVFSAVARPKRVVSPLACHTRMQDRVWQTWHIFGNCGDRYFLGDPISGNHFWSQNSYKTPKRRCFLAMAWQKGWWPHLLALKTKQNSTPDRAGQKSRNSCVFSVTVDSPIFGNHFWSQNSLLSP